MNYASLIDHTILKPEAQVEQIKQLCQEAIKYGFASVCVNPCHVPLCAKILKGSKVKVCTVIGFPLGANTTAVKAFETKDAIDNGAEEIDMVINVGALKDKNYDYILNDITRVVNAADGKTVKVIIETCLLTDEEKEIVCKIALNAGAHFVKTSTGFNSGGATINDVALMKRVVGDKMEVKASGGIRNFDDLTKMVQAGATRIGTSGGPKIIENQKNTENY